MPRKLIKRWFPHLHRVHTYNSLQLFGRLLHNPNLWHLNRRSVAGSFAVGLFTAFLPVPFQMVVAAIIAMAFRVNLPIAVMLVWVSNPFTMAPLFFAAYKLGEWVLDVTPEEFYFELSLNWLMTDLANIWQPFLLGCFLLGAGSALIGYAGIRLCWRYIVVKKLEARRRRRESSQLSG